MDFEQLVSSMDLGGLSLCTSCAASGEGVLESLATLSRLVLERVTGKNNRRAENVGESVEGDSESFLELCGDTSRDEARGSLIAPSAQEILPSIALACQGTSLEGTILRIPLDVSCGGTNRRLIVTVSVDPE